MPFIPLPADPYRDSRVGPQAPTATAQPASTPTETAIPGTTLQSTPAPEGTVGQQPPDESFLSLVGAFATAATEIFWPYYIPFAFGLTVVLLVTALISWVDVSNYILAKGALLWLLVGLSGAVALMAGLTLGMYAYGISAYLLQLPPQSFVDDLTTGPGVVSLVSLILATDVGACVVAAAAGATQWVIFRPLLPRIPVLVWIVVNLVFWPGGFLACFTFALSVARILPGTQPVILMVMSALVPGVAMGRWLGHAAQDIRPPLTLKIIAEEIDKAMTQADYEARYAKRALASGNHLAADLHSRMAINQFTLVINLDPTSAAAYHKRAMVYDMLLDRGRAIEDLRHAIALTTDTGLKQNAHTLLAELAGN